MTTTTSRRPATILSVKALVARRAEQARAARRRRPGLLAGRGRQCPFAIVGAGMALVTPGIRPAGAGAGDQKRIMTPAAAIAAGADYLVVGRPIIAASDPRAAAEAIVAEIAQQARKGERTCPRPTGSGASTCTMRKATSPMRPPIPRSSANTAAALSCAPASSNARKAAAGRAMW